MEVTNKATYKTVYTERYAKAFVDEHNEHAKSLLTKVIKWVKKQYSQFPV